MSKFAELETSNIKVKGRKWLLTKGIRDIQTIMKFMYRVVFKIDLRRDI